MAIVVAASLIALIIDVLFINNKVIDNIKIDKRSYKWKYI